MKGVNDFVSLFCGCGGFDIGFQMEGFRCVRAFDSDPLAVEHHTENLNSTAEVLDLGEGCVPAGLSRPAVVLAGPPCQGFSTAGKRELDDPRNGLLLTAGKIALHLKPEVFVAENVRGVASGTHRRYWDSLEAMLRDGGYRTASLKCEGNRLGVPQSRTRMILIAWGGKEASVELPVVPSPTLKETLKGAANQPNHKPRSLPADSDLARIAKRIRPGQKLCNVRGGERAVHTWDIPEVFGEVTGSEREVLEALLRLRRTERRRDHGDADPVGVSALDRVLRRSPVDDLDSLQRKGFVRCIDSQYDLAHTFNGKFRRLDWNLPSPTVDTRFGDPRYFLHPDQDRGFSVREAARIQGFPDSFVFHGSVRDQYRLIGNAVPPPVAACVARVVRDVILS
jgi:DNA (cytosine-5)-methyltransferase 1